MIHLRTYLGKWNIYIFKRGGPVIWVTVWWVVHDADLGVLRGGKL
jgi:hypothetical protein